MWRIRYTYTDFYFYASPGVVIAVLLQTDDLTEIELVDINYQPRGQ